LSLNPSELLYTEQRSLKRGGKRQEQEGGDAVFFCRLPPAPATSF
jgi:hypothetical protein